MNFVIIDFPREIYLQHSGDITYLERLLSRDYFSKIGYVRNMIFHKVFVEERKKYYGEVKQYQLFVEFHSLKIPKDDFREFKCKFFLTARHTNEYIFQFQPFKNLEIGDVCLFDIPYTTANRIKFIECWDSEKPLREAFDDYFEEQKKTHKPWLAKIIKIGGDELIVETVDEQIQEKVRLDNGQIFQYITYEGFPTFKM